MPTPSGLPLWEIYYDDETVYMEASGAAPSGVPASGITVGKWKNAPANGVQFVLDRTVEPKLIHMGQDYYMFRKQTMTMSSFHFVDLHAHILLGIPENRVKFGRWADNAVWGRIHDRLFPPSE